MKHKREAVMLERKEKVLFSMMMAGQGLAFLAVMAIESAAWPCALTGIVVVAALVLQLTAAAEICRCTKKGVHKK